jgi:predicted RNA-binding Zn-ribbon protein involved in translation (DUF1610 family)
MAENTTNYQCPACTGPLRFDSASGKLCCDYCGSTYDVAQVEALYGEKQAQADKAAEAAEKAASSGPVWGEMETGDLSSRTCTSCGAELVCGPETAATTCPYCGNPTVLGGQLSGKLKPEYIIPFRMDKKTAIENLKKYYKGKAFLPKAFKESNHIEEIQGVYVPFWLYDGRMEARRATVRATTLSPPPDTSTWPAWATPTLSGCRWTAPARCRTPIWTPSSPSTTATSSPSPRPTCPAFWRTGTTRTTRSVLPAS